MNTSAPPSVPAAARVLVVDDDPDIREMLCLVVAEAGYEVLAAADGQEALALLADPDQVGLVLLDWMMPVCDGGCFAAGLARLPAALRRPVVVVVAASEAQARARQIGAAAAFSKPFDLGQLLASVALLLGKARAQEGKERDGE